MRRIRKGKQLLAVALSALLAVSSLPTMVFANGGGQKQGEHTVDCGYATGQPCGHEHTGACYTDDLICGYIVDEDNIASDSDATASDSNAEHTHTQECYALDCPHEREEHKVNGVLVKNIADWTFIDDDNYLTEGVLTLTAVSAGRQADFNTVVSMLPTQIRAEVEGETDPVLVDITGWSCLEFAKGPDGNWPLTGEYTFTANLQKGYACEPMPTVKVLVGGAELYGTEATVGDFTVEGDSLKYEFIDPVLTIKDGATLTIKNATPNTPTVHRIRVENGATADITLAGVNIEDNQSDFCAFEIAAGATVTLNLETGTPNILKSGDNRAGLEVPDGAKVIINGDGSLDASSSGYGAGIGSARATANNLKSGVIEIRGGTITATSAGGGSGDGGAGIGGGGGSSQSTSFSGVSNGTVTISGGVVKATGGGNGAGIGGGGIALTSGGNGGTVTISGGTVTAIGSGSGAGIGGGGCNKEEGSGGGMGSTVMISGAGTQVTATGGSGGLDIGGGAGKSDGDFGYGGGLTVKEATLEMTKSGTNVTNPDYKKCTIIDRNETKEYNENGTLIATPTLSLEVDPTDALTLPGILTIRATMTGASPNNEGKTIELQGLAENYTAITDELGVATWRFENPKAGRYSLSAKYEGNEENKKAETTTPVYCEVKRGTQADLILNGLVDAYTYGDEPFGISTTGGSGTGEVTYSSSNQEVAGVTGSTVSILKAGEFTITATKNHDSIYEWTSVDSDPVTVSQATPDVSLTYTGGDNINIPVVLTATVAKVGTGKTPSGKVTFYEGSTVLKENVDLDSDGKASVTISNFSAGSHLCKAVYSGETGYYNENYGTCTVGVGLADQTGFAISDPGTKTYGDSSFTLEARGGQSEGGISFSAPANNGVLTVTENGIVNITGAGSVTVRATKAGDNSYKEAVATLELTVAPRDISHVVVAVTGSRIYTGGQLQPAFEVKDGSTAITTGDYTNSYGINVDAGTGAGSITLTGQRNYAGTKTVVFDIEKRSLAGAAITLGSTSYTYTGSEIKPAVAGVVVAGVTVPASAFDVGYTNNTEIGTATVTVTARADSSFTGTASTTFEIARSRFSDSDSSDDDSYTNPDILRGSWVQTEAGVWMFRQTGGSYAMNRWGMVDGLWYFFDAEGKMLTGWQFLGGQWYYLCTKEDLAAKAGMKEGAMVSGWHFDPLYQKWFYLDTNGAMITGWREIDGKWHYFNPASDGTRGTMVTDSVIDGRYIDKNGVWNGEA